MIATACTGDAEPQAGDGIDEVGRTIGGESSGEVTTTTQAPTTTAAPETTTTTVLAPSTLAFASSDDIGRLFTVSEPITAAMSAGGAPDASTVSPGTIVQASSARTRDDVMWVRIESTVEDGPTFGWVPASALQPTLESVFYQDNSASRQFRIASNAAPNDQVDVLANPGAGAPIAVIPAGDIAMHGGVTALSPSGDYWLDLIDPGSGTRLGWVEARLFNLLTSGEIKDSNGDDVGRSRVDGVSYGQALVGGISQTGCNAVQITFTNTSASQGLGIVFGTSSPVGRQLNSGGYDWSGTSAFSEAGVDVIITIPTSSAQTWYFASLDGDENASFSSVNEDGFAVADSVISVPVPGSSCQPTAVADVADDDPYQLGQEPEVVEDDAESAEEGSGELDGENSDPATSGAEEGQPGETGAEPATTEPAAEGETVDPAAGDQQQAEG